MRRSAGTVRQARGRRCTLVGWALHASPAHEGERRRSLRWGARGHSLKAAAENHCRRKITRHCRRKLTVTRYIGPPSQTGERTTEKSKERIRSMVGLGRASCYMLSLLYARKLAFVRR